MQFYRCNTLVANCKISEGHNLLEEEKTCTCGCTLTVIAQPPIKRIKKIVEQLITSY